MIKRSVDSRQFSPPMTRATREELTGYLRELSSQPELVERMGYKARLAAEKEFDMRVCGAKLAALYRELIQP